ncbi:Crp/Fnr family transcriptional regulator [Chryseosolibacter indicus]|uniref:Crp/Fnr family transcriptional regulator n=1 Tax=Chryseosolibacter indicus TaxID=2782351 RepID=A0ABS5VR66_9BACT|nr:Crp/Fnr family transcriptional regulator [Chryseosolibacter indicus]MBT1703948.1 Crp/Fnr family transcriptional regulator [Chryseosolibacter indicus]
MNTELILKNVSKHITLNDAERQFFLSMLESRFIKRKELHLKEGEVCKHSTFIVSGALKGFTIDKQGIEHVINFAIKDWWIGDMYSLISQQPGILNIEALADSEVLMLSRENQHLLYEKVPKFERFFRIIVENSLVASQQRLINNLSLTAEERYLEFMKKYSSILEYAPLHTIASYLGITPEFLSKIRGRMARKPA